MGLNAVAARLTDEERANLQQPDPEPVLAIECEHVNHRLRGRLWMAGLVVMPCDRPTGHPGLHRYHVLAVR